MRRHDSDFHVASKKSHPQFYTVILAKSAPEQYIKMAVWPDISSVGCVTQPWSTPRIDISTSGKHGNDCTYYRRTT